LSKSSQLFFWAFGISFLGTLPVGTLNVSVANLAIGMDTTGAIQFALGAVCVEMLLVRVALVVVRKLEGMRHLFTFFSLFACLALWVLAGAGLWAAFRVQMPEKGSPLTGHHPFMAGLLLSFLNPLHLPFWMGWTSVLKSRNLLTETPASYNRYVTAIGTGTSLAFFIYGLAGHLLIDLLRDRQMILNIIVSLTLLMSGLLIFYKKIIAPARRTS
jgi:threonine/homoserine/homoserine lactone efflux protein